jgi:hypothetical protein
MMMMRWNEDTVYLSIAVMTMELRYSTFDCIDPFLLSSIAQATNAFLVLIAISGAKLA